MIKHKTVKSIVKEIFRMINVAAYAGLIGFSLTAGVFSFLGYMAWIGG